MGNKHEPRLDDTAGETVGLYSIEQLMDETGLSYGAILKRIRVGGWYETVGYARGGVRLRKLDD